MRKIHKDPLTREREFRQTIERAAQTRRAARIRRARPWLGWLESLAALFFRRLGRSLFVVALLAFGGLFVYIFGLHVKGTEAYACSLAEARRSPSVIAELGEPVEAGFFAWSHSYSQQGSVTDAAFRTELAGPKGEGTLRVRWYSSPVGSSLHMELERDGRAQVVYDGAAPCR